MELQGVFSSAPNTLSMLFVAAAVVGFSLLLRAAKVVLWKPWTTKRAFEKQGVKCLPYYVLLGNLGEIWRMMQAARASPLPLLCHEVTPRIVPHYHQWKKTYGDLFVYWLGYRAVLPVTNLEHAKEILLDKFGHFKKVILSPDAADLLGESVLLLEGERWAQRRRIVNPAFFAEKLKVMTPKMLACIDAILEKWESQLEGHDSIEIDVFEQFKVLTADIIAHTAFGTSYEEGKQVFKLQQEQQLLMMKFLRALYIPGSRYLPTPGNRYARRLKHDIHAALQKIIKSRRDSYDGNDLLGILMAANRKELSGSQRSLSLNMQEVVDECKTFFVAGHETTASLMTWTVMLLAVYSDWQEKAREEVLRVCGSKESPTYELLHGLKVVGMVLNEALRLYPPAAVIFRETTKGMTLGSISVPANTLFFIPVTDLHTDPTWWGEDALDFNPQRFVNGISGACKSPLAFCPFSVGPRNCLGQNFAMLEGRAILALMLRRFAFSLSPGYTHCPTTILTLQPQHGMPIIFKKLE